METLVINGFNKAQKKVAKKLRMHRKHFGTNAFMPENLPDNLLNNLIEDDSLSMSCFAALVKEDPDVQTPMSEEKIEKAFRVYVGSLTFESLRRKGYIQLKNGNNRASDLFDQEASTICKLDENLIPYLEGLSE